MIEKIGPTIYKGESIYKTGGGGGGGGEIIPEGYKKCQYVENIASGRLMASYAFNDLLDDDYIEASIYATNSNSWGNALIPIGYQFGSPIRNLSFKQNTSNTQSVVNGFSNQVSINSTPNFIVIQKKGSFLSLNGTSINNDTYNGTVTGIANFFYVDGSAFVHSKLFYVKILSNDQKSVKHNFIPYKNASNQDIILDTITGVEFVMDTSKFICGPVVE